LSIFHALYEFGSFFWNVKLTFILSIFNLDVGDKFTFTYIEHQTHQT